MKQVFVVVTLLLLAACAPSTPAHVMVSTDEFNPHIDIDGPMHTATGGPAFYRWGLHSVIAKETHHVTHALYFDTNYFGAKDPLTFATDDTGRQLVLLRLHPAKGTCNPADPSDCNYTEKAEVMLSVTGLKKRVDTGFKIKIMTRDGTSYVLPVTPGMVKLQIDAVAKYTPN